MGFKLGPSAFRWLYTKTMLPSRNKTALILRVGSRYINLASTSSKGLTLDCWDHFRSCIRKIGFWTILTQPFEEVFGVSVVLLLLLISKVSFSLANWAHGGSCFWGEQPHTPSASVVIRTSYARLYIHVWLTSLLAGQLELLLFTYFQWIFWQSWVRMVTIMAFQTCLKFCFVTPLELWRSRNHVTSYEMGKFWEFAPPPLSPPMKKWILEKNVEFLFQCKMLKFFFGGGLLWKKIKIFGEKTQFVWILFSKGLIIIPGSLKAWKDEHNNRLIWGRGWGIWVLVT